MNLQISQAWPDDRQRIQRYSSFMVVQMIPQYLTVERLNEVAPSQHENVAVGLHAWRDEGIRGGFEQILNECRGGHVCLLSIDMQISVFIADVVSAIDDTFPQLCHMRALG